MRALLVVLCATRAFAEPEGSVREETVTKDDGLTLGIDTSMRVRSDGKAAIGAGLAARFGSGPWSAALSIMRWHPLEDTDPERSWELAGRAYRHFRLSNHVRAHVVGGVTAEHVHLKDGNFERAGILAGVGLSWKLLDRLTAWTEVTVEAKRWITRPEDRSQNEFQMMFTLGFTF